MLWPMKNNSPLWKCYSIAIIEQRASFETHNLCISNSNVKMTVYKHLTRITMVFVAHIWNQEQTLCVQFSADHIYIIMIKLIQTFTNSRSLVHSLLKCSRSFYDKKSYLAHILPFDWCFVKFVPLLMMYVHPTHFNKR